MTRRVLDAAMLFVLAANAYHQAVLLVRVTAALFKAPRRLPDGWLTGVLEGE